MKMRPTIERFLVAIALLWAGLVCAQVQVTVSADSGQMFIGDQMGISLVVNAPQGVDVQFPTVQQFLDSTGWELVRAEDRQVEAVNGKNIHKQRVFVTAWEPGDKQFPPLEFGYTQAGTSQRYASQPLLIQVQNPPSAGDSTYIAGIKPIIAEPATWMDYIWYILIVPIVGLVVFIIWVLMRLRKGGFFKAKPFTPEDIMLQRLDALRKTGILGGNDFKELHGQFSYILREYLETRFKIPALRFPTSDFLMLVPSKYFDAPLQLNLKEILETADLVKFAKASPLESAHKFAETYIQELAPMMKRRFEQEALEARKKIMDKLEGR